MSTEVREVPDRRGRAERGSSGLLERDVALDAIDTTIEHARAGRGAALLFEAHAGMGKTRLYEAALDRARAAGMTVFRAAGSPMERDVGFGVARQLLESLPRAERVALLRAAPASVQALVGAADAEVAELSLAHGVFAVIAAAAEISPALVAIDDLHWSDAASLAFVLYLLHRLDDLPAAVLLTRRPGGGNAPVNEITAHPRVRVRELAPLGRDAVAQLSQRFLGARADTEVVEACERVTAGNPFYLHELLLALADEKGARGEELARHALALAPDAVVRAVRVRVGRLGAAAASLARSLAILGDDVPLRQAATLGGLGIDEAGEAADALAAAEVVLAREPLKFVHPLVLRAIEHDIPAAQRAGRHLDAARLLDAEGAEAEQVAAHLLLGRAEGSPWAVDHLRAAAREAARKSSWQSAVRYLQRALEEPAESDARGDVLAELGEAEARLGLPEAAEHFALAVAVCEDPFRRAKLQLRRGHALFDRDLGEQARNAYQAGLAELSPSPEDPEELELYDELRTGVVSTDWIAAAGADEGMVRLRDLTTDAPATHAQRLLLARAAMRVVLAGDPASAALDLAERAWDEGRLLERDTADGVAWRLVSAAFLLAGDLERCVEIAEAAADDSRRHGSPLAFATASFVRGLPELWQGRVDDALADLELARDARRYGWRRFVRAAASSYCLCLIEKGELDRAQHALTEDAPLDRAQDLDDARRLYALAELRLAQGRPREALEAADRTAAVIQPNAQVFGYCPWRTVAAQAALALGERDQALECAREALAIAERTGVSYARIRALRVLGICEGGEQGMGTMRASLALGERTPPRLETVRALVDLGAALRRTNQRAAAREPLQRADDLAREGGAQTLRERARTELQATGARPRREALLSGPASLTPSERRIAELAATGQSNREIALALFVTPKTVEYHLRNVYRKLDIATRRELTTALSA